MCKHLNPRADMFNISPERHNIINLGGRERGGFRSPCPCAWIMTARIERDDCQGRVCVCRGFSASSNLALGLCRKQMSNKWPDSLWTLRRVRSAVWMFWGLLWTTVPCFWLPLWFTGVPTASEMTLTFSVMNPTTTSLDLWSFYMDLTWWETMSKSKQVVKATVQSTQDLMGGFSGSYCPL